MLPPRHDRGARAILAIAALGAGLGAAELAARALPDRLLGFRFEAGRFVLPAEFAPSRARNRLGFHDVEPGPRRPGTRRVVLLGDSYVEGSSVAVPQTVGRRLARHLTADAARPYDVVALGRRGWAQRQERAALRQHGAHLRPDLVLSLVLPFNDVRENWAPLDRVATAQLASATFFVRPGWTFKAADDVPLLWVRGSVLNQLLSHRLAWARRGRGRDAVPLDYFVYAPAPDARWEAAWRETERLLLATRRLARRLGARYAIVSASTPHGVLGPDEGVRRLRAAYPGLGDVALDLDAPDARLARFARVHGIPFLALEPAFREAHAAGRRLHWRWDGHWNAAGNDLAGARVAAFVRAIDRDAPGSPP